MASSFRKRGSSKPSHPRGTRPSLHNAQLLVSTGVPSLDVLLGGGLAVGTVLLVEEDVFGSYSRLLLKYFLAEGVMCGHSLFVASASECPEDITKDLPGSNDEPQQQLMMIPEDKTGLTVSNEEEEQMKIAWRYQNQPKVESSFSNRFGHFFDLTTSIDKSRLEAVSKTFFNAMDIPARSSSEVYDALRTSIQGAIDSGHYRNELPVTKQGSVLRVALQSLGSPLWLGEGGVSDSPLTVSSALTQFLHSLRAMLRCSYAVGIVSIPTHIMQDTAYVNRLERLSDAVIKLESFAGSDKNHNPMYREYHGLFHLRKLPSLNSLTCHFPDTMDLAFKLKKKKFVIEKLHLPPELSETVSRTQEETNSITKPHAGQSHTNIDRGRRVDVATHLTSSTVKLSPMPRSGKLSKAIDF